VSCLALWRGLLVGTSLLGLSPLAAQSDSAVRSLVFTDTGGFRLALRVRSPDAVGAPVRAMLRAPDGTVTWQGALGTLTATDAGASLAAARRIPRLRPWSPTSPVRYDLLLDIGSRWRDSVRIGFRTVRAANGRILLNGRPVFLKGNAINPPGRNIPDSLSRSGRFARDYLRTLKAAGVNLVRLGSVSDVWLDAADDVGMLVFQGNYGTPRGGSATRVPANLGASLAWYRDTILAPQVNHPSVVVYALTNETADPEIHYQSDGAAAMGRYLQTVYDSVHVWDPTRLVIANAGYGFGRTGELCDLHRYWGWYYNSFLSFYTLRDPAVCWRGRTGQPITMSEVVGNYTGADGRFNLVSDTKQPDSQLNWTGHAPDAEQGPRALAYQAWLAEQAIEIPRRLRSRNPNLAGIVPFSIVFSKWHGITRMADMGPKPIVTQYRRSFQPVLLSWETWTPQRYAGDVWPLVAHVVNDADDGRPLTGATLVATLRDPDGRARLTRRMPWPVVPFYGAAERALTIPLPTDAAGRWTLHGALVRGGDTVSRNVATVRIHARRSAAVVTDTTGHRTLRLYDPSGRTRAALAILGVRAEPVRQIVALDPARDALLVGREAWDATLSGQVGLLEAFVNRGGRALILDQDPARFATHWLPGGVRPSILPLDHQEVFPGGRPWAQGMAINPERPSHPVFAGLTRDDLFLWSDYTGWRESSPGFPAVYPVTRGYALTRPEELGRVAVLANYDHGLVGQALTEHLLGRGSVILSAFDLIPRIGHDPVADRLCDNLVAYLREARPQDARPVMTAPILWGDYAAEQGIVTGAASGLLVHTVPTMPEAMQAANPVRIDAEGFWLAGGESGGWNTRPAIQYVARGRRPYGPYEFTSGGSYKLLDPQNPIGEGRVWWRAPAGHTVVVNRLLNPTEAPLEVTLAVQGKRVTATIPPRDSADVTVPLTTAEVALHIRGDRRLVLLRSETR